MVKLPQQLRVFSGTCARRVPCTKAAGGQGRPYRRPAKEEQVFAEESPDWDLEASGSVICEMCGEEPPLFTCCGW